MPAVSGARRIAGTGSRIDAASESAIAAHTIRASGPDQTKNAAGSDGGSHGSTSSARSHKGASDAPRRQAAKTAAGAMATANHALDGKRQQRDARVAFARERDRPLRQPRGRGRTHERAREDQAGHGSLARGN